MPIYLTAAVKPTGNFPVFQDTDGYGGFQVRSTTSDRDSIPSSSRKSGMLVYVLADGYFYQLNSNLTTWSIASFNASNIQGNPVSSTAPTSGQVLAWNGSSWIPTSPTVVGGATNASLGTIQLSGDLSGTASSPKLASIQGYSVSSAQPGDGYVFIYDTSSTSWKPTQFLDTTATAYDGYVLSYSSSGKWTPKPPSVTSVSDASSTAKGIVKLTNDFGGTATLPIVTGIQGVSVDSTAPTDGYVFVYSGNTTNKWKAQPPSTIAPNASSLAAGLIKLAKDIGGSYDLPQVTGLLGTQIDSSISPLDGYAMLYKAGSPNKWQPTPFLDTTVNPLDGYVLLYSSGKWKPQPSAATSSAAGMIKLAGELGGTYDSPKVTGLLGKQIDTGATLADGYVMIYDNAASQWKTNSLPVISSFDITSFSASTTTFEYGATANPTFNYTLSNTPASLSIIDPSLSPTTLTPTSTSYSLLSVPNTVEPSGTSTTKTVKLSATYSGITKTKDVNLTWTFNVYYGVGDDWPSISNKTSFINTLTKKLQSSRNISYTPSSTALGSGKYVYYLCPASYQNAVPFVNGMQGGMGVFNTATGAYNPNDTVSITVGATSVTYNVYWSDYAMTLPVTYSIA